MTASLLYMRKSCVESLGNSGSLADLVAGVPAVGVEGFSVGAESLGMGHAEDMVAAKLAVLRCLIVG